MEIKPVSTNLFALEKYLPNAMVYFVLNMCAFPDTFFL